MPRGKTKNRNKKTRKKSLKPASPANQALPLKQTNQETVYKYVLAGLILLYFLGYFYKLYASLNETVFWSDEAVHAYISSIISNTHQIPFVLPDDIYGGFEWSYPPLFHIFSAMVLGIAGVSALKFINLVILVFFLACFYILIRKYYGANEAVIACLLLSLSPVIAINTVRFLTEMLSMFMIFFSFFFMLLALTKKQLVFAVIAGLSTGLLLLSKQIGIIVLSFHIILFFWFLLKKEKDVVRMMGAIIGITLVVYLPYLILALYQGAEVFSFLSLFAGNKPDWAKEAVTSFRRYDFSLQEFAYHFYTGNGFVITSSILLPLYYFIKKRDEKSPLIYIFIMFIYLITAMAVWHITNSRHTIVLLPLLVFLVGFGANRIAGNKKIATGVIALLLFWAGYSAYQMPNYRQMYNAPPEFMNLATVIKQDNESSGLTFSIHPFGVVAHAGKPAIWPFPNLRHVPVELVEKTDTRSFYNLLKKYKIIYILIDRQYVYRGDRFWGRNYPTSFYNNCLQLKLGGKILVKGISESERFLLLKVL